MEERRTTDGQQWSADRMAPVGERDEGARLVPAGSQVFYDRYTKDLSWMRGIAIVFRPRPGHEDRRMCPNCCSSPVRFGNRSIAPTLEEIPQFLRDLLPDEHVKAVTLLDPGGATRGYRLVSTDDHV
jgi:hypothetical protein